MTDVLHVTKREETGSSACRRLRKSGIVPAVLYGHGKESLNLSVPESELSAAIRHGSKLVTVEGDVSDSALLREIQWDAFGAEILHIDLTRVSAEEMVEVELTIDLRGEAPGVKEGGVIEQIARSLSILCPAGVIPDKLEVNINQLHLGESLTASDVLLPEKAELVTEREATVVQCLEPVEQAEEEETAAEGLEPEVIGRAAEDESEES